MIRCIPKPEKPLVSPALRNSAKGQKCSLRWADGCDDETVVLAHVRGVWSGTAQKSPDYAACFACRACNFSMESADRPPPAEILRAVFETWAVWIRDGLIRVGGRA